MSKFSGEPRPQTSPTASFAFSYSRLLYSNLLATFIETPDYLRIHFIIGIYYVVGYTL